MRNQNELSSFRHWLNRMWFEHKEEVLDYTGISVEYDMKIYILKYKWWLKAIYKKQLKENTL